MRSILAIAIKDVRLLCRDRGNFFFTFIFPVLFALFFGLIFRGAGTGKGSGMDIAVVDEDAGTASRSFVEALRADGVLRVHDAPTRDRAIELVRTGGAAAGVIVPKGFEERSTGLFAGQVIELEVFVDPSRRAEAGMLEGKLQQHGFGVISRAMRDERALSKAIEQGREALSSATDISPAQRMAMGTLLGAVDAVRASGMGLMGAPDIAPENAPENATTSASGAGPGFMPLRVNVQTLAERRDGPERRPRSSFEISLGQGVVWGLMGCVMAFASSMAGERSGGTLRRLCTAPVARSSILLGKALACLFACVCVQGLLLAVMLAFGVRYDRPIVVGAVVLANAVGFTGLMACIAGLARTEGSASGVARGIVLVLAMIGGGTVPLFFLPGWVQTLASISPFKWGTLAVEGATWRGFGWGELALPMGIMLAFALAGLIAGSMGMSRMVR